MSPPTRTEFLRSRFYRCAVAFNKRNEQRLKNIRDLLEKADNKERSKRPANKKRYVSTWRIPACDDKAAKNRNSKEDQAILSANQDESDWVYDESNAEYVLTLGGLTVMKVPNDMFERLKPFQRDAVKWVAGVGPTGGILADDMGMGKTFMSIASIGARMRSKRVRMVLVVAPVSVLNGWKSEACQFLSRFVKTVRVIKVHGGQQKDRQKAVRNAWKDCSYEKPHVVITSWGLACSAKTVKTFLPPSGHNWDYVILDEAHLIKNHTSTRSKCCFQICKKPGTNRLLLTGTPFQNDTTELWSIVHMATAGKILGKIKEFNKEFGKPIREARCRNASSIARKEGDKANEALQETLKPYLLRRRKMDFLQDELPDKLEICVWVKPSSQQQRMYKEKIEANGYLAQNMLSENTEVANKAKMGAFQVLNQLRGICGHPLRLLKGGPEGDIKSALEQTDVASIIRGSKKLELVLHMLKGFKKETKEGLKTLLFSQSTQNLDVIQHVLKEQGEITFCRLDGSVSEKRRADTVACFEQGLFDVMLVSTGAGGTGLTLIAASRVIVFDPSWNPSEDAQAVDRAYRIGQKQEVRVYRLFLAGGIEEKMYEKQVHKTGMETTIFTSGKAEERYFDKHELCKVFAQVPDGNCELLKRFEKEGVGKVPDAIRHDLVRAHSSVIGISNHSNIYSGQKRKSAFADAPDAIVGANKRMKSMTESEEVAEDAEDKTADLEDVVEATDKTTGMLEAAEKTTDLAEEEAVLEDETTSLEQTTDLEEEIVLDTSDENPGVVSESDGNTSDSDGSAANLPADTGAVGGLEAVSNIEDLSEMVVAV